MFSADNDVLCNDGYMIPSADNEKLSSGGYGYSSINITDEGLLSLLRNTSPSLEAKISAPSHPHTPLSFEVPFDDPSMEPMPLRPQDPVTLHPPIDYSTSASMFMRDDCLSSSVISQNTPSDTANLQQDLLNILDPAIDMVGFKRSPNDILSDQTPFKLQRTNAVQDSASGSTDRFRPYQGKQWRMQFQKLVEFKIENGHCCVPHSYPEDPVLARWVKRQRYQYKKMNDSDPTSTMTTRRIADLESIGFVWHSHASAWQEKLNELIAFKQSTGHCNVPSHYPSNVPLSTWVKCQRRQYKLYISGASSNMTMERFQMLEALGFVFGIQKSQKKNEFELRLRRKKAPC